MEGMWHALGVSGHRSMELDGVFFPWHLAMHHFMSLKISSSSALSSDLFLDGGFVLLLCRLYITKGELIQRMSNYTQCV